MTVPKKRYELYLNGKLVEQYNGPTDGDEIKIGDGSIVWPKSKYTECGNCGRTLLVGEGCGLC